MKWIVLGNLLTMAYKSTLLPTLVTITYDEAINTAADLDQAGLPLMVPGGTSLHNNIKADDRPLMKKIYNNSIIFPYTGTAPPALAEM